MTLVSERFSRNSRLQAAARNTPPLKKNEPDREAVALVQQALVDIGFSMPISMARGKPDGIYGDETVNTVAKFQTQQALQRDGQAGRDTLHRLDSLFPPVGAAPEIPTPAVPPLTELSVLLCPHSGTVMSVPTRGSAPPTAGPRILTVNDVFVVNGCPFVGFLNRLSPCLTVRWVVSNPQFRVNGADTLTAASVGLCENADQFPQGSVIIARV
jgi:peptidoglycan hydrolase-like protein with peptidoglycan-binding domain